MDLDDAELPFLLLDELDAKRDELEPDLELLRELLRELDRDDDELNRELLLEKREDEEL